MGELAYKYDSSTKQDLSQATLRLTCICDLQSFAFAVENAVNGELVCIRSFSFGQRFHLFDKPLGFLEELMQSEPILYEDFKSKTLFVRGVAFKLHRGEMSDETLEPSLLTNDSAFGVNNLVMCDRLQTVNISVIYAIPSVFHKEVGLFFRQADIRHSISGLICSQRINSAGGTQLIAQVSGRWLEVAVRGETGLLFANHFQWTDPADIIYYIAAVIDGLDQDIDHYTLGGLQCDENLIARLTNEFKISIDRVEHRNTPESKLIDLSALEACE